MIASHAFKNKILDPRRLFLEKELTYPLLYNTSTFSSVIFSNYCYFATYIKVKYTPMIVSRTIF
jgi:hypothetical protein